MSRTLPSCTCPPHDSFGVNSPLSIHSVEVEKNVSHKNESVFLEPGIPDSCISGLAGAGKSPKFREKTFHPLPDGIGCDRIRFRNFLAGNSVELDLNQKIELRAVEQTVGDASMQKVPQHSVPFHKFVVHQWYGLELLLGLTGSMTRSFPTSPFEELSLNGTRNGKSKMRLAVLDLPRVQDLQKNTQGLLGDVGARKLHLLLGDPANRSMQHGNKSQNHQALDKLRCDDTS
jgi:hypothetical protein